MVWIPHVTVAAVVERDGRFLLVEEETDDGIRFNQPAGHLECGESLSEAAVREALEETAYGFVPECLVGIYNWRHPQRDLSYLRFAFGGYVIAHDTQRALDAGILAAHWLTFDEIRATRRSIAARWSCAALTTGWPENVMHWICSSITRHERRIE